MNRLPTLFFVAYLGLSPSLLGACADGPTQEAIAADHSATLSIEGMTCASCSVTVHTAVRGLEGLATIDVDVGTGRATVTYDSSVVTAHEIAKRITEAGYATTVETDREG